MKISPDLVIKVRAWLGYDGCAWFSVLKEVTGTVSPVLRLSNGMPHPVHLREGMTVRNFMRESGFCDGWSAEDLDNTWAQVIGLAIYA